MEIGRWRKALDNYEGNLASEIEKERCLIIERALYFSINERNHESDLTQIRTRHLNQVNPMPSFYQIYLPDMLS
jgi:hypothetical protein